jgi:uncharacterized phiE125 gp8 family phage protein
MNRRLVTLATEEPLTLAEVKTFLRVDHEEDDQELQTMIRAAREQAELHHGRELARQQWDVFLDAWPAYEIRLPSPLVSVESVSYKAMDGSTADLVAGVDYFAGTDSEPGAVVCWPGKTWPATDLWPSAPIRIRCTCGYTREEVTDALKAGMKMLISGWYDNRSGFSVGNIAHPLPFAAQACFELNRLIIF